MLRKWRYSIVYFVYAFLVLSSVTCLKYGNLRIKMAYRCSVFLRPRNKFRVRSTRKLLACRWNLCLVACECTVTNCVFVCVRARFVQ